MRFVVLTGGPGAGKTAVLELVRLHFHERLAVLPESASIVFGGGFPRRDTPAAMRAAQRAIYHVQRELEALTREEGRPGQLVVCDRGTLDGLAYWPGDAAAYWAELGTTQAAEFARYDAVIHLRTPSVARGYNQRNPLRIESARLAAEIDERILAVWREHPRRFVIESSDDFMVKIGRAMALIRGEIALLAPEAPPPPVQ